MPMPHFGDERTALAVELIGQPQRLRRALTNVLFLDGYRIELIEER